MKKGANDTWWARSWFMSNNHILYSIHTDKWHMHSYALCRSIKASYMLAQDPYLIAVCWCPPPPHVTISIITATTRLRWETMYLVFPPILRQEKLRDNREFHSGEDFCLRPISMMSRTGRLFGPVTLYHAWLGGSNVVIGQLPVQFSISQFVYMGCIEGAPNNKLHIYAVRYVRGGWNLYVRRINQPIQSCFTDIFFSPMCTWIHLTCGKGEKGW